jgi:hypothetical protein
LSQGAIVSFFSERRNRKALHRRGEGFPEKNEKNVFVDDDSPCGLVGGPEVPQSRVPRHRSSK